MEEKLKNLRETMNSTTFAHVKMTDQMRRTIMNQVESPTSKRHKRFSYLMNSTGVVVCSCFLLIMGVFVWNQYAGTESPNTSSHTERQDPNHYAVTEDEELDHYSLTVNGNEQIETVATRLMTMYLDGMKENEGTQQIKSFKILGIERISSTENAFTVKVKYTVIPEDAKQYLLAGSAQLQEDDSVKYVMFATVHKEGDIYTLKDLSTSPPYVEERIQIKSKEDRHLKKSSGVLRYGEFLQVYENEKQIVISVENKEIKLEKPNDFQELSSGVLSNNQQYVALEVALENGSNVIYIHLESGNWVQLDQYKVVKLLDWSVDDERILLASGELGKESFSLFDIVNEKWDIRTEPFISIVSARNMTKDEYQVLIKESNKAYSLYNIKGKNMIKQKSLSESEIQNVLQKEEEIDLPSSEQVKQLLLNARNLYWTFMTDPGEINPDGSVKTVKYNEMDYMLLGEQFNTIEKVEHHFNQYYTPEITSTIIKDLNVIEIDGVATKILADGGSLSNWEKVELELLTEENHTLVYQATFPIGDSEEYEQETIMLEFSEEKGMWLVSQGQVK